MHHRYVFVAAQTGTWRILSAQALSGQALVAAAGLEILPAGAAVRSLAAWVLQGVTSILRYATRGEVTKLRSRQEALGRAQAQRAALIPIKKSAAWWKLAQDQCRAILEEQSHHTQTGLEYLPAVARQLYHSRDLGEPFDFLTWFEYAPEHSGFFDELLARLRASPQWTYVEREVDIRLERAN